MLLVFLIGACAADAEECSETDELLDWETFGAGFFASYCRTCHSATTLDRYGAPAGLDFDTLAQVRASAEDIHREVIDDGTMPLGGGVLDADLYQLSIFLTCGL